MYKVLVVLLNFTITSGDKKNIPTYEVRLRKWPNNVIKLEIKITL